MTKVQMLLCLYVTMTSILVSATEADLKSFIERRYHHGIPYEWATQFGTNVVPDLLNMLGDPAEEKWLYNIVMTLGIIGDERAVDPLIRLLEQDTTGEVQSDDVVKALLSVYKALGHLAASGNDKALDYLVTNAMPETWNRKKLPWTSDGQPAENIFQSSLIHSAIMGLGISGQPKAVQSLERMKNDVRLTSSYKSSVIEALALAERLKRQDRSRVFGGRYKKAPIEEVKLPAQGVSITNSVALGQQALEAFEEITQDLIAGRIDKVAGRLADNGKPLVSATDQDPDELARVSEKLKGPLASDVKKTIAILQDLKALQVNGGGFDPPQSSINDQGVLVVKCACPKSESIPQKHISRRAGNETINEKGELVVVMLFQNSRWYWNPFGW